MIFELVISRPQFRPIIDFRQLGKMSCPRSITEVKQFHRLTALGLCWYSARKCLILSLDFHVIAVSRDDCQFALLLKYLRPTRYAGLFFLLKYRFADSTHDPL